MATICAQQDQHTAILRQIQQHLRLLPPLQPNIPIPSEPIALVEDATKAEVPIQPTQETTIDASSSHDPIIT